MRPILLAALLLAIAIPSTARAAQSYDNCTGFIDSVPATLTTQGVWCLRSDLSTAIADGNAITVATNNVTIDCNDFKIGGLAAGAGTGANGISSLQRLNTTIRNCNIRGFYTGVNISGGSGHVVEENRIDGSTFIGIAMASTASTIRDNIIIDTGGGTLSSGFAYGIFTNFRSDIVRNSIDTVTTNATSGEVYGIHLTGSASGAIVAGNSIRLIDNSGSRQAFHVRVSTGARAIVQGNNLVGTGVGTSYGISCGDNLATASGNVLAGFSSAVSGCTSSNNVVNPN